MSRHPTLTCSDCQHTAPVHEFPCDRDGLAHVHRCPACDLIVIRDGLPVNGASASFQRVHTLPITADLRNAQPDIQNTIPIIGYIDATNPDLTIHSPLLEKWAKTANTWFFAGPDQYVRNGVTGQLYLVEQDPKTHEPTGELIPLDAVSNDRGGDPCPT
jgi:hypothetical protein